MIPKHVKLLSEFGHKIFVEKSAGVGSGFSDEEYVKAGAKIKEKVYDCEMVVRVKEPNINTIKESQIIMGYLHIEKGQNPELFNTLIKRNVESYAYEEIRDDDKKRLVNLGYEAGLVGMYEGLRFFNKEFPRLRKVGFKVAYEKLSSISKKPIVAIMGNGNVSRGVQLILKRAGINPIILDRTKTPNLISYLKYIDILVNAVVWYPSDPQLLKRYMLKHMKKTSLILDISCDKNGAVETCIPTTWENPMYKSEEITHICIDNLPSAIPRESSIHLSTMIFPYVLSVANRDKINKGLMTKEGEFVFGKEELIMKKISIKVLEASGFKSS